MADAELITRSLAALSATAQTVFHAARVEADLAAGRPPSKAGRTAADDLAIARRTSPYWGSRELASARALTGRLPHTLEALMTGTISGHQARIISEATTCLSPEDASLVDHRLHRQLPGASTKEVEAAVRALVYEVDPAGYVDRARRAAKDRGVSIRPAPDVMATLSAHLPAASAIACHKALQTFAKAAKASGDPRGLNQLMADELFHRLTGRHVVDGIDIELQIVMTDTALLEGTSEPADLIGYGPIPADLARDLLRSQARAEDQPGAPTRDHEASERAGTSESAGTPESAGTTESPETGLCPDGGECVSAGCTLLHGQPTEHTPTPASSTTPPSPPPQPQPSPSPSHDTETHETETHEKDSHDEQSHDRDSRDMGSAARPRPSDLEDQRDQIRAARVWARRLYTDPVTGVLKDMDPRRRLFKGAVRALIISRDRYCRTPWCGAPIRDIDHIRAHRDGGRSTPDEGQGLCARCNQTRERSTQIAREPDLYSGPPPLLPTLPGRRKPPRRTAESPSESDGEAA